MSRAFPILVVSVLLSLSILGIITLGVDAAPFQTVYSGLNFPVAFTFAHDGRMFFNEKNTGNVRVIASNGTVLTQPFANLGPLPPTTAGSEEGLLGLALDPNFDTNHYLYIYWTYWDGTQKHVRITRFTDAGNLGASETTIFDFVDPNPGPTNHNGGYIKFGPDGMLYATVGDFCSWDCSGIPMAQNKTNYAGKILRMNPDGSVPSNNPFSGSLVYAYGFRNGIGLDFNSTGGLIATMAGPDCCDRIFFVNSGANLGWPNCGISSHVTCSPPYTPSLYQWGSTVTPTGIAYSSDRVLYFGEFNTGNFMQLALTTGGAFSQLNTVASGFSGGVIAVEKGPDGRIWFSTSSAIVAYTVTKTTATLTATQTSTLSGIITSTFTSYTSTTTSTSTVPTVLTVVLIPITSTVQGTQYQTSFVTVTSYASTSTSTSTIPTVTTVTVGPPTSTIQNTQIVTATGAATATSVTTTTTTSHTSTQFSTTSTTIVVTTVTTTSSSFGEALILLSIVGLGIGFGVEAGSSRMIPEVLLRVGRRCLKS